MSAHVSVVIPTRNTKLTLQRCLSRVFRQCYPSYEVIVEEAIRDAARICAFCQEQVHRSRGRA